MPKSKRIGYLRADAASYQAEIFNYCTLYGKDKKSNLG